MVGVGQFPKFVDQAYAVQEGLDNSTMGQLYFLPTAEAPVANIHREEILKEEQLPIKYCAYSPCFVRRPGLQGGYRGMIRVHQFDKVELIKLVKPENGYDELEKMVGQRRDGAATTWASLSSDPALHRRHGICECQNV